MDLALEIAVSILAEIIALRRSGHARAAPD
jgi:xanthine/CO dehydrogenase XdhC/CoxF family maturation factor